jgi:Metalloenzyme superfamily
MLWLLLACKTTPGVAPEGADDPHVLIFVLDGVRPDEFSSVNISDLSGVTGEEWGSDFWKGVAPLGRSVREAVNPALTSTTSAHALLLTGRPQPVMTVPFKNLDPGVYFPLVPTLFEEARQQKGWGEDEATVLANAVMLGAVTHSIHPAFGAGASFDLVDTPDGSEIPEPDDSVVITRLKKIIDQGPPKILLVNLHDSDRLGHEGDKDGYLQRIRKQSKEVSDFYEWMQSKHPSYAWQTLMVVTADHGRHRHDEEGGWINHGDSCTGCREVPMVFLGRKVEPEEVTQTYTLLDIAPTLAAHLGVELPWGIGLPLLGEGTARQGLSEVAASGSLLGWGRYLSDISHRSVVEINGEQLSDPDAFAAEGPSVLEQAGGARACFRELHLDPGEDFWPWIPRCFERGESGWREIGFPDSNTGPSFRAALAAQGDVLGAAWLHTPLIRDKAGEADVDQLRLSLWEGGRWSTPTGVDVEFSATDVSLAATGSSWVAAIADNEAAPEQAYTRRIEVYRVAFHALEASQTFDLAEFLDEPRRVEQPALRADGEHVYLAMIGMDKSRRGIAWVESKDAGQTWEQTQWIPGGDILLHQAPVWSRERLYWAEQADDQTRICSTGSPTEAITCLEVDSPRLESFSVNGDTIQAIVDAGSGQWELRELKL